MVLERSADLLLRATAWGLRHDVPSEQGSEEARLVGSPDRRTALLATSDFFELAPTTISRLLPESSLPAGMDWQSATASSRKTPVDQFSEAVWHLRQGRGDESLRRLTPNLLEVIDPFSYWIAVGRAQAEVGQHETAELSFSFAIRELPDSPIGYFLRGRSRMFAPNPVAASAAVRDFDDVIRLCPTLTEAYLSRALAKEFLRDEEAALDDIDTFLHREAASTRGWIVRSRLNRKLGNPGESEADRRRALASEPMTVDDWVTRALAKLPRDPQGALDDLIAAERIDPRSTTVLQNKAHVLSEHLQRRDDAIESLNEVLRIDPLHEKAKCGRAVLLARNGDRKDALDDLRELQEDHVRLSPASLYQIACAHALLADRRDRSADPVESDPDDSEADHRELAFHLLAKSLQRGYGGGMLTSDPDLASLRGDPRLNAMIKVHQLGQGPDAP